MAKVYGLGASVVLLGALFKINHYPGADYMLIVGLGTEAIIFFFSAWEPPYVDPDWSLVYPELAGMYHGVKGGELEKRKSPTQRLDEMLEKAKLDQRTIDRLLWMSLNDNMNNMLILADAYRRNDVDDVLKGTEGVIATELMLSRKFPGGYRQEYINSSDIIDRINEFVNKYPDSVLKDAIKGEN